MPNAELISLFCIYMYCIERIIIFNNGRKNLDLDKHSPLKLRISNLV